jgi:hypothetical protein
MGFASGVAKMRRQCSLYAGLVTLTSWTLAFGRWSRRTLVAIDAGRLGARHFWLGMVRETRSINRHYSTADPKKSPDDHSEFLNEIYVTEPASPLRPSTILRMGDFVAILARVVLLTPDPGSSSIQRVPRRYAVSGNPSQCLYAHLGTGARNATQLVLAICLGNASVCMQRAYRERSTIHHDGTVMQ